MSEMELTSVKLGDLAPGYANRLSTSVPHMDELKASINERGIIDPLRVQPTIDEEGVKGAPYRVIDGHRRLKALKELSYDGDIPILVEDVDEKTAAVNALLVNIQRNQLNQLEIAAAYSQALEKGYVPDQRTLAAQVGCTAGRISQLLKLLEAPDDVKDALEKGVITEGAAVEAAKVEDPAARADIIKGAIKGDTVRKVREKVSGKVGSSHRIEIPALPDNVSIAVRKDGWELTVKFPDDPDPKNQLQEVIDALLEHSDGIATAVLAPRMRASKAPKEKPKSTTRRGRGKKKLTKEEKEEIGAKTISGDEVVETEEKKEEKKTLPKKRAFKKSEPSPPDESEESLEDLLEETLEEQKGKGDTTDKVETTVEEPDVETEEEAEELVDFETDGEEVDAVEEELSAEDLDEILGES